MISLRHDTTVYTVARSDDGDEEEANVSMI